MGRTAVLLAGALSLAACNTHTPAPAYTPTPMASEPRSSEPADVGAFRADRDAICRKAAREVAAASVQTGGISPSKTATVARRVADQTEATQQRLDKLQAPRSLRTFIETDAARRRTRVRLLRQLADAVRGGGDADALTAKISQSSASSQAAENKQGLANCP